MKNFFAIGTFATAGMLFPSASSVSEETENVRNAFAKTWEIPNVPGASFQGVNDFDIGEPISLSPWENNLQILPYAFNIPPAILGEEFDPFPGKSEFPYDTNELPYRLTTEGPSTHISEPRINYGEVSWDYYPFFAANLPSENPKANEAINYNKNNNTHEDLELLFELLECPNICSIDEQYKIIKDFQESHALTVDGKIGPYTLQFIYTELFSEQTQKLSQAQLSRLEYFWMMSVYPNWRRPVATLPGGYKGTTVTLAPSSNEAHNAFRNSRFLTDGKIPYIRTVELENGLQVSYVVDRDLLPHVAREIDQLRPIAYQFTHPELGAIMIIYAEGKLLQAQKVGLGRYKNPTPNMSRSSDNLPEWFASFADEERLKYYLSGAERVLKYQAYKKYSTAVMPYAVPIDPNIGIYAHAGDITGLSSGCIRQSGIHAQALFENYSVLGEMQWIIQGTRNPEGLDDFMHLMVK